ncbi:MAG TPA: glycosyltransferase, partial [Actinoplanes sp.]
MRDTTDPDPLAAAALRAGSVAAREPLARAAGGASVRELVAALRSGTVPPGVDAFRAGELARVLAVSVLRPGDRADALAMLAAMYRAGGLAPAHRGLYAQLALATGDTDLTRKLLDEGVPGPVGAALCVDLGGLDRFTALFPAPALSIADGAGPRFDRIVSGAGQRIGAAERITTIVVADEAGPALLTAVRSLVAQTWTNHEILVVGDAGHEDIAALDPRIRIIRSSANAGLDAATGDFIAFGDPAGWSHPVRLERQAAPMRADPALVATTSNGLEVTADLRISRVGMTRIGSVNPASLMIRRERVLGAVGHPHPVRRDADVEYVERIRAVFGRAATVHLDSEPLALIRCADEPESVVDARVRRSYRSAFQAWHHHVAAGVAPAHRTGANVIPRRLRGAAVPGTYDVVLAGDWTGAGGAARSGVGRIRELMALGLRTALLHLDVLAHLRHELANLDTGLQDLINAGAVEQVELDDDVRVRLVVAQSADVLSHAPDGSGVRADQVVIESSAASAAARPGRRLFGVEPVWAPPGPAGRRALTATPGGVPLAAVDLPGTVDAAAWRVDRRGPRADRPVVGRCCHGGRDEWRRLSAGLPDPGRVDVRLLDGTGAAARAFGRFGPPHGWLVYTPADVSVRNFLYQLDYYLPLPAAGQHTDPDPEVLTALAAGCVAVLPPPFAEAFGDAAVYCAPDDTT